MKPIFFGQNTGASGSGEASAFSDDFNRADSSSLGSNWTEVVGGAVIGSNQLIVTSGSWNSNLVMWNTPVGLTTQYQKATLILGSGDTLSTFVFRATSNTGQGYSISFDKAADIVSWYRYSNLATGAGSQQIGTNQALTVSNGDIMGVTLDGFGNNTVVRVWRNPSGLPLSAANWNGDTTPSITLTSNPTSPCDTGLLIGLYGIGENTNGQAFDNWFGGSL